MSKQEKQESSLSSRLALARKQAGLTQAQVAEMVNLHRPSISQIESGRRRVSSEELKHFAEIYGVDVGWLIKEKGTGRQEDKIELAARELGKLKDEDLDRVLNLLSSIRSS